MMAKKFTVDAKGSFPETTCSTSSSENTPYTNAGKGATKGAEPSSCFALS